MKDSDAGVETEAVDIRDLAVREVLGLVDEIETDRLERAFSSMSPDEQAGVLDLQAAVAREISAAGLEAPDRALRYHVLARMAEEITSDAGAAGPIAMIGGARGNGASVTDTEVRGQADPISGLQSDRLRRSAVVWRAAAFALGSAVLALGILQQQAQSTLGSLVDRLNDRAVAADLVRLAGDENELALERLLASGTAEAMALVSSEPGCAGFVITEEAADGPHVRPVLVLINLPDDIEAVRVVEVDGHGGFDRLLGDFDVQLRTQFAALPLDSGDLSDGTSASRRIEVRDLATGRVLLATAVA